MNCNQVKQIKIEDYLSSKNILPTKIMNSGASLFYMSPLRNEKTASFKVNSIKNIWYDHGEGVGGNIIDLVMKMENIDLKQALENISSQILTPFTFSPANRTTIEDKQTTIVILKLLPITDINLIEYVKSRKISLNISQQYLHQITYSIRSGKVFNSLGFKNDLAGYELRNEKFKGCTSKYYTTIEGTDSTQLNIFEGFFDFLSAMELSKESQPKYNCLVLNSIALKEKTFNLVATYQKLNLFLDNDNAGEAGANYYFSIHGNVKDYSKVLYPKHKDLNDYLQKQARKKT